LYHEQAFLVNRRLFGHSVHCILLPAWKHRIGLYLQQRYTSQEYESLRSGYVEVESTTNDERWRGQQRVCRPVAGTRLWSHLL